MTTKQDQIREQSAALAAMLGEPRAEGGFSPRPPTPAERRMLDGLKRAGKGAATPTQLIAADPETFAGTSITGLHMTGSSLVRKGLVTRGRRTDPRTGNGGSRLYRLTEAGRNA